ncbi:MAG TPA: ABC-2 family transporter protein [Ktedonobacterales bacterium]|nr:ABC-2 family transporter protein [Ktedonobacterales bacterium]
MLSAALRDLRLYRRLIGLQLRVQAQYKSNLATDIATYFLVTSLEFAVVPLVFAAFPTLLGWSMGEVALVYALTSLSFGLAELFGGGIDAFDESIRRGDFDRVLLRPAGALLQIAASEFRLRRLGRLTEGALVLLFALHLLPHLRWTSLKLALLPLGALSGAVVFDAVMLLGATMCFWTVQTSELTNILTYGGREMLSWPLDIYNRTLQRVFLFVVPLAFASYLPACYLLDRPLPFGVPGAVAFAAPLIALAAAVGAVRVWSFGVRHYQSTGS